MKTAPMLVIALLISTSVYAGPVVDPHCYGDTHHNEHGGAGEPATTSCAQENNPHFDHVDSGASACESSGAAKDCRGCFACCNGQMDERVECTCEPMAGFMEGICSNAAVNNRANCQGFCADSYGSTCDSGDIHHRIPD